MIAPPLEGQHEESINMVYSIDYGLQNIENDPMENDEIINTRTVINSSISGKVLKRILDLEVSFPNSYLCNICLRNLQENQY